jgi:hypothetical protein
LLFAALNVVAITAVPMQPSAKTSGANVIAFFTMHRTSQRVGDVLGALAVVSLVFFAGTLYSWFRGTRSSPLGVVALVGTGLLGVAVLVSSTVSWALTDAPTHYSVAAAQALNAISYDVVLPLIAGLILFAISTGIAVVREGWLPNWLGWTLLALGVVSPTPAFPLFGVIAWSAIVAVILATREAAPAPARASLIGASA